jgi:hypothetical protein
MLSYVALPRTGDTVKSIILPTGFIVGSAARGLPDISAIGAALIVWVALELLVYQARYQWNDIRGFEADQQHPGGDRGRLPGPRERRNSRFAWSGVTAAAKVVGAIGLCWALDATVGLSMLLLTAGVFGLAVVYESLRSTSTGRTDQAPAPITRGIVAIWVVIGAGYALRAVTGLALAADLTASPRLVVAAVLTAWAFGIAWITSRWAVEATDFARLEERRLRWHVRRDQAREHQLALARWLPREVPASVQDLKHWSAVREGIVWSAPWNLAGAVAAGGAVVTGVLLVEPDPGARILVLCACLGVAGGVAVLAAGSHREVAVVLVLPMLLVGLSAVGVESPVRACLPWLAVSIAQACYLRQDSASMGQFLRRSAAGSRGTAWTSKN